MSRSIIVVGLCALAIALSLAVRTVQQQNEQILGELSQIRQLVEKTAPAERVTLSSVAGDFLGRADAPLTMVEFTDLQCPFCRQFHATAFAQIKRDYIDTGKLRYISRDFPLDTIHPLAIAALRADRCAGEQGKFWEMRHAILGNGKLKSDSFAGYAKDLTLDVARFNACVGDTARLDARWQSDRAEGVSVGVTGTPAFVIGRSTARGLEGIRLAGAKPYSVFDAALKDLLGAPIAAAP